MFKRKSVNLAALLALGAMAAPALAQQAAPAQPQQLERIEITGSRIKKLDLNSASPLVTVTGAELRQNQDITLETFLNALPQINPAGTTTSNNPGNGGQANIDLRGLGANRNLILIDGRRPMVSAANQAVDINTIPLSLIENIEVITGGAGAVYGADAIGGVVNVKLKRRFEGLDIRAGLSNAMDKKDARERSMSLTTGGNFAGSRGNAVMSFEFVDREQLIKSQRDFAAVATATTSFFPEGTFRPTGNNPSQAAVDALYGQAAYGGAPAGTVPNSSAHAFNLDGSLIYPGIFNSPRDVLNWRYPIDSGVNTNLFPDVYSYNFDAVNILTLPLERRSFMAKMDFAVTDSTEVFASFSNTRYSSTTALAPTPVSTVAVGASGTALSTQASSPLVTPGTNVGQALIVPTTNPFIPADLRTLLNSRTGDNPNIIGSGATEPFLMRWRTLGAGLRKAAYENNVTQYMVGARGELVADWTWEAYLSEGRTKITNGQSGNIDTNRLLATLAAADGGASLCAGGVNPFGRQPLSAACTDYLEVSNTLTTEFKQTIGQAFVSGEVARLPAGAMSAVLGAEFRNFEYSLDPGAASGPISGFNVQNAAGGRNSFKDLFGELQMPLARRAPMAESLDLSLAVRSSESKAQDPVRNLTTPKERSNAFALNLTWQPTADVRARGSLQKSVRAPNFGELFDGGGSAPQYYDPCSVTSKGRTTGANAAQLSALCAAVGAGPGTGGAALGGGAATYVQTPGTQASINLAGNINLKPETGESATLGLVWVPTDGMFKGFSASFDYYRVDVKDAITTPDTNELVADCYNYYGNNSTYSATYGPCRGIGRAGDIFTVRNVNSAAGTFAASNDGRITTDGIDVALGWGGRVGPGKLDLALNMTYLLSYELKTLASLPTKDFAGSIPYFGAGLGQAFPKLKMVLGAKYKFGDFTVDTRLRYIDKMDNRMSQMFPGEVFTGASATTYVDLGGTWEFAKGMTIRAGLNNAMDKKPPTYAPNVQSGTDPSTYDVIGRRFFVQAGFAFN